MAIIDFGFFLLCFSPNLETLFLWSCLYVSYSSFPFSLCFNMLHFYVIKLYCNDLKQSPRCPGMPLPKPQHVGNVARGSSLQVSAGLCPHGSSQEETCDERQPECWAGLELIQIAESSWERAGTEGFGVRAPARDDSERWRQRLSTI